MAKKLINLAKALDFQTEIDYFNYCMDSHTNGNFSQCKTLFSDMGKEDRKEFLRYVKEQNNEIYEFYFNLL